MSQWTAVFILSVQNVETSQYECSDLARIVKCEHMNIKWSGGEYRLM